MPDSILLLRLEHGNMARLLEWLDDQIEMLESGITPDHVLIGQALYYLQNYPDICHHPKEDLILDAVLRRDPGRAAEAGDLAGEHRRLAELTHRVSSTAARIDPNGANDDVLLSLRELVTAYRRHMAAEEESFFPLALEVLSESDWESIDFNIFDRDDPLFDHSREDKFRKLRESLTLHNRRHREVSAVQKEMEWLRNLSGMYEFNRVMEEAGSKLRLVGFAEGGYCLEREGKLLAYIPSPEEIHAVWCAFYYAKGAENISLAEICID